MHKQIELRANLFFSGSVLLRGEVAVVLTVIGFAFSQMCMAEEMITNDSLVTPASAPLDATLYTSYMLSWDQSTVLWYVIGSTKKSYGGYGAGTLGPFSKVGPMLEGFPTENLEKRTVTREIYVVDVAAGTDQNEVSLYVYVKTDHLSPSYDNVTVDLRDVITLPLVGGTAASASMAGDAKFLYIGTNQGPVVARVTKRDLAVSQVGDGVSPSVVSAITADLYGYINIAYANLTSGNPAVGCLQIAPDGTGLTDAGGPQFMLNPIQAVQPSPTE